jgi:hypothetical protein
MPPVNFVYSIGLNINYVREIEIYKYIGYGDIISSLGGLKAAISQLFNVINPILALVFLIMFSSIFIVRLQKLILKRTGQID